MSRSLLFKAKVGKAGSGDFGVLCFPRQGGQVSRQKARFGSSLLNMAGGHIHMRRRTQDLGSFPALRVSPPVDIAE